MPMFIVRNDITKMQVDAIVNAANTTLMGGGGVDGAIHRAAGPEMDEECFKLHGCRTGEAKLTKGYRLPCKYVIHTAGPIWQGGDKGEKQLLEGCYRNSLELAKQKECETVAFPLISAGIYGYPKAEALRVAMNTITSFLADNDMTVYIVVFTQSDFVASGHLFGAINSFIDDKYASQHYYNAPEEEAARWREAYLRLERQQDAYEESVYEIQHSRALGINDTRRKIRADKRAALPLCEEVQEDSMLSAPSCANWDDIIKTVDEGFSQTLLRLIDDRKMTDAQCYKRANIDRRLFNKIKNTADYRPSKLTVLALAVSLELKLNEANMLLEKAGYALTHSSKTDLILEYCFVNGIYDINDINEVLFSYDLQLLGSI